MTSQRACIIAATADNVVTRISVDGGVMKLTTRSDRGGDVFDSVQIDGKHPGGIRLQVNPKPLRAGYGAFDRMLITGDCFVMANDDAVYMVAAKES